MPVGKHKRKPQNAKSLKEKLDAKAKAKDDKAICSLVQEDLEVGGTAKYQNSTEGDGAILNLTSGEEYLVFIIAGGFTVGNSSKVYTGNGVGHPVSGESVLTLEKATAVVIISGY